MSSTASSFINDDWLGIPYNLDRWWIRDTFNKNETFPPYNIGAELNDDGTVKTSYFIEVAVAGMKLENLHVEVQDQAGVNFLYIKNKIDNTSRIADTVRYSHKGIATRLFKLVFELGKNTEVSNVSLSNGILRVDMQVIIAEEEKPKIFEIKKAD